MWFAVNSFAIWRLGELTARISSETNPVCVFVCVRLTQLNVLCFSQASFTTDAEYLRVLLTQQTSEDLRVTFLQVPCE